MKITRKEFLLKCAGHFNKLWATMEKDKLLYGDSFVEFTDRKIEVVLK